MKESEAGLSREEQKARIRERYKGVDPNSLEVIPAKEKVKLFEDTREKNVAAYCRVSTDDPNQTSSYELQKNHYTDMIENHVGWNMVGIYADEGISGTSMMHREELLRLLRDCEEGKVDVIVTKSVSRLARNIRDCIEIVRKLADLNPPVGVLFETEGFFTLEATSEMMLAVLAAAAQEESHTKSEIMNVSIDQRFRRGIFLTPVLLGYDQDENGNLVINEQEAGIIRYIFYMYMDGYTCQEIADNLTAMQRKTKRGNTEWSAAVILQILQNERHCGDVLARKTFTPNYLNHKSKKNNHDRPQYRQRDHHEAIISRDDFIFVQHLIANNRAGGKGGYLPELQVITTGYFAGFVPVNTRWAAFTEQDYLTACRHVKRDESPAEEIEVTAQDGDLVESYGLKLSSSTGLGNIVAVAAMESVYNKYDIHVLDRTLRLLLGTWQGEPESLCGNYIRAVAQLIATYGDNLDENRFKEKLGNTSLKYINRNAKEYNKGATGYAFIILECYNQKLQHPLESNLLYRAKK